MADDALTKLLGAILRRLDAIEDQGAAIIRTQEDLKGICVSMREDLDSLRSRLFEQSDRHANEIKLHAKRIQEHNAEIERIRQLHQAASGARPRPPRP